MRTGSIPARAPGLALMFLLAICLAPASLRAAVSDAAWQAALGKQVIVKLAGESIAGTLIDADGQAATLVSPTGEVLVVDKNDAQEIVVGPRSAAESFDAMFSQKPRRGPAAPASAQVGAAPEVPVAAAEPDATAPNAGSLPAGQAVAPPGDSTNPLITGEWQPSERAAAAEGTPQISSTEKGGIKLEASGTLEEAEKRRLAWIERGGAIMSYGLDVGMSLVEGKGISAVGGTLGVKLDLLLLRTPNPVENRKTLLAGRFGIGARADMMNMEAGSTSALMTSQQLSLNLGGQVGFGSFGEGGQWSGVVLGLDWILNMTASQIDGKGGGDPTFNYKGFDFTLDFTDLASAVEQIAQKAQWRLTVFLLPPIKDMPFMMSIAVGIVSY